MVGLSQELLLVCDDLREWGRCRYSILAGQAGRRELIEQRDHMLKTRRRYALRSGRGIRYDKCS